MARKSARAAAMQMVFEHMLGGDGGEETLGELIEFTPEGDDAAYMDDVLAGVLAHQSEIDAEIGKSSRGWSVERLSRVDLAIMRLSVYEMFYREDVPASVAINEAVALAGRYSLPTSGKFVNGVLGDIWRRKEAQADQQQ